MMQHRHGKDSEYPINIILASSSPYRAELLKRLQVQFTVRSPAIDEARLAGEPPADMVTRLANAKAAAIAEVEAGALVIASDQAAFLGQDPIGKPGNHAAAVEQLRRASGNNVVFYTGLCVLDTRSGRSQTDCIHSEVRFRSLTDSEIERYLALDKPYDCAGSFKSESLGITLVEQIAEEDPTALVGLPLIRLSEMLRQEGLELP